MLATPEASRRSFTILEKAESSRANYAGSETAAEIRHCISTFTASRLSLCSPQFWRNVLQRQLVNRADFAAIP